MLKLYMFLKTVETVIPLTPVNREGDVAQTSDDAQTGNTLFAITFSIFIIISAILAVIGALVIKQVRGK